MRRAEEYRGTSGRDRQDTPRLRCGGADSCVPSRDPRPSRARPGAPRKTACTGSPTTAVGTAWLDPTQRAGTAPTIIKSFGADAPMGIAQATGALVAPWRDD